MRVFEVDCADAPWCFSAFAARMVSRRRLLSCTKKTADSACAQAGMSRCVLIRCNEINPLRRLRKNAHCSRNGH
jgi:hypothetical protein